MTPEGPEEANYGRDSRDRPDPDSPGPNRDAATLTDAVEFYNQRFNLCLTAHQKADLGAFLQSL